MKLSGNFLHSYLAGVGSPQPSTDQEILDLIGGNFLLANSVIGMLAPLRRKSVDEVLDELPARDEGFPHHPSATPMWATTVDLLRYARASGWQQMPQLSLVYDVPTALRNSFNLAVAVTFEFAAQTGQPPAYVARILADAANLGDRPPSEMGRDPRRPRRSPQTAAWFG